jgi:hypothetical protein
MTRLWLIVACLCLPATAAAQERRWEVEGYAGILAAQPASAGTQTLPPAGPPIVTSTPTFPSRATPSWFFGDGATLLNGALGDFGLTSRLSPLDPVFAPLPSARAAVMGLRVRRRLHAGTWLEIGVDTLDGSPVDVSHVATAIENSRASFAPAFTALFASGPFTRTTVTAQGTATPGSGTETFYTAALNRDVAHLAALQPYVTLGAGIAVPRGTLPSALLEAHYATAILGEVPIDETDMVSVRFTRSTALAIVAGGGVRRALSANWSLRLDARLLLGPDATRVTIDATPSVVRGAPAGFIESFTNPAIQFSNDPSTGRVSTLSGAALHGVEVFNGGWLARTLVGVAVSRRF